MLLEFLKVLKTCFDGIYTLMNGFKFSDNVGFGSLVVALIGINIIVIAVIRNRG